MKQYMIIAMIRNAELVVKFSDNWQDIESLEHRCRASGSRVEVYEYEQYKGYVRIY